MKYSLFTVSVPEMTPEQALKKMNTGTTVWTGG